MRRYDLENVIAGILKFCDSDLLPADTIAIHKSFKHLCNLYPRYFVDITFKYSPGNPEEGFSPEIDDKLSDMIFGGLIGICGKRMESLFLSEKITTIFDPTEFEERDIILLRKMGKMLPELIKKHESEKYKQLLEKIY